MKYIDPMTGKPREQPLDMDENALEDIEDDFEEVSKINPYIATEEFREYMDKRRKSKLKLEELYGDDQPYEAKKEE